MSKNILLMKNTFIHEGIFILNDTCCLLNYRGLKDFF